ncbi:MAG: hypothetical protein O3B43_07110, partial [Chloroflexi bacterium]|nr:hypothetical protein [Chloroflexota bacterium]
AQGYFVSTGSARKMWRHRALCLPIRENITVCCGQLMLKFVPEAEATRTILVVINQQRMLLKTNA